jgi:hypothetical protein
MAATKMAKTQFGNVLVRNGAVSSRFLHQATGTFTRPGAASLVKYGSWFKSRSEEPQLLSIA